MKLVTAAEMRALEKRADASGNSYAAMLERAGTLTARAIGERWPVRERRVLVLVGPGNNGGDGLVCARVLRDAGAHVLLYLWKREPRADDVNWRWCRERGIDFARAEEDAELARLKTEIARADFIIDALLGTGVARPLEGLLEKLLYLVKTELAEKQRNSKELISPSHPVTPSPRHPTIIAVDLPTGLNPDTGALDPAALPVHLTVTFAFPKIGQYLFPGARAVGELVVADIGIAREWADDVRLEVATGAEMRALLPARPRDANKGTFGKALLAVGSLEFTGAPTLAAAAAGRVGAGLVTLALARTIHPIVAAKLNEATYLPLPDTGGAWSPRAVKPLCAHARAYAALLIGCGLGRAASTRRFVERLLKNQLPSLVLDADGLNVLAEIKQWWQSTPFSAPPILTPHPGEMARLIGASVAEVQRDRIGIATRFAAEWDAVLVLKGAFAVIAAPNRPTTLMPFANPALATAGTGDVLAGAIVGFLAQYRAASERAGRAQRDDAARDAFDAALVGAYIHGLAGELVAREIGNAGAVAGDLIPRLPAAIRLSSVGRGD